MGVLAPLLIILALKNGAISSMVDRLVEDPSNRELIAIGAATHGADFFDGLRARQDVAFVVPATRSINAVANAVRHQVARKLERTVTMIPSAAGDPLSGKTSVSPGVVLLSAKLAENLEADVGATLELRIDRRIDDIPETAVRDMTVGGIVPDALYSRAALFVSLPDLVAVEKFRDDRAVTTDNWTEPRAAPDAFASFRLYATSLGDIGSLERYLESIGVNNRPRAENVEVLIAFQRGLNILFFVIAALAFAGFWAAMAANLRGTVERQRVSLSLLRFLGLSERGRQSMPVIQSVVLVTFGVVITLLLVLPTLALINLWFTPDTFDRIAFLQFQQVFWLLLLGLLTAVTASIWAIIAIRGISSDEVLRAS